MALVFSQALLNPTQSQKKMQNKQQQQQQQHP
jgi:hypothetical protein